MQSASKAQIATAFLRGYKKSSPRKSIPKIIAGITASGTDYTSKPFRFKTIVAFHSEELSTPLLLPFAMYPSILQKNYYWVVLWSRISQEIDILCCLVRKPKLRKGLRVQMVTAAVASPKLPRVEISTEII